MVVHILLLICVTCGIRKHHALLLEWLVFSDIVFSPRFDSTGGIKPVPFPSNKMESKLFLKMCHACIADNLVLSRVNALII